LIGGVFKCFCINVVLESSILIYKIKDIIF
jgi:hypothetical protein